MGSRSSALIARPPGPRARRPPGSARSTRVRGHWGASGPCVRSTTAIRQRRTEKRAVINRNIAICVQAWRELPDTNKLFWKQQTLLHPLTNVFGNVYYLNAYTFFMRQNLRLTAINKALNLGADTDVLLDPVSYITLIGAIADIEIDLEIDRFNSDWSLVISATKQYSGGRYSIPNSDYYKIAVLPYDAVFPYSLTSAYQSVFSQSAFVLSQVSFFRCHFIHNLTGNISAYFYNRCVIDA